VLLCGLLQGLEDLTLIIVVGMVTISNIEIIAGHAS
jgi:hypothetical protein